MKTTALAVTLAVVATAICASLMPAYATKMNGRCCQWSDGGRSFRYRFATMRTEFPTTPRKHAVSCINQSWNSMDAMRMCLVAGSASGSLEQRSPTATSGI